jgi:hypothetical protein
MNKPTAPSTLAPAGISPEEWQARIDLAAVYRLIAHYGWDDVIYNHSSMRVPGEERKFLIKRHELLYTEVTASASTGPASRCTAASCRRART